ncbi:TRAP transporter substrate-binding protein DctP [Bacteriovoracaceae bacterium]|nr:TRAP transporter substrate-binding protein DctP [Bacteriovoracaceae bacterium]
MKFLKIIALAAVLLLFNSAVFAKKYKISVLAPKGTTLANAVSDLSKKIKKKTEGRVQFKVYYGGISGDEPVVLKKIRIGQMHGSFFTGKTLGDIQGDLRVMELPFNYMNKPNLLGKSLPTFEKDFEQILDKKGFVSLGFFLLGEVYLISTKKIENIKQLNKVKIWSWEGDQIVNAMMKELGCVTVPLALPDVLPSLSSGIIEATYGPPLGIIALQWHTKVKYLVNVPAAYSIGALVLSKKSFNKIKKEDQVILRNMAKEIAANANAQSKKENDAALKKLKEVGIKFIDFPKSETQQAEKIRTSVIKKLEGKVLSKSIIDKFNKIRK